MGYELNKLMRQFGVATPTMAAGDAQYTGEYQRRMAETDPYNQAQFSTTGASVPAINTLSLAQRYATGAMPAVENPAPGYQEFAGIGQTGLNQRARDFMRTNPSQQQFEETLRKYGENEYDIRNAMGTGVARGAPQWSDVLSYTPPPIQNVVTTPTAEPVVQPDPNAPFVQPDPNAPFDPSFDPYNQGYDAYGMFNPEFNYGYGMYPYARGGRVKGYQAGGLVDPETGVIAYPAPARAPLMRQSIGAPAPMQSIGAPAPMQSIGAPAPAQQMPAASGRLGELEMMLQRYGPQDRGYADEISTARQRSQTEADAFAEMLNRMISSPEDEKASKAEMYFRLAAAFGSPTQTGQFTENLALAGKEMADVSRGKRESSAQKRSLMLEAQKLKMGAAKDELETLRGLEAESMRDKRAVAQEIIKDYIASGKPQSNAGRIAQDMGLQPGSEEYIQKVNELSALDVEKQMAALDMQMQNLGLRQANLELAERNALRLSPTEIKLRADTEDILESTQIAMEQLADAYSRNPNSLAGGWVERGQQFLLEMAGSDDPAIVNTRVINNLLSSQAVAKLKATFGGNISDGERSALDKLQGINAVSREERAIIMRDAYKALQSIVRKNQTRLDQIRSGEYRMTEQLPETLGEE
jgi:hypothetical protein